MKYNQWSTELSDSLFQTILKLNSLEEAKRFFRDLLTEEEIREFANRWKVAQMLSQKISYTNIEKATGMSTTTIARISRWLNAGMGGYKLLLKRQNNHHDNSHSFENDS